MASPTAYPLVKNRVAGGRVSQVGSRDERALEMTEPLELKDEDIRTTWQRGEAGPSATLADPDAKDADGTDGDSDGTDGDSGGDADGTDSDSDTQDS